MVEILLFFIIVHYCIVDVARFTRPRRSLRSLHSPTPLATLAHIRTHSRRTTEDRRRTTDDGRRTTDDRLIGFWTQYPKGISDIILVGTLEPYRSSLGVTSCRFCRLFLSAGYSLAWGKVIRLNITKVRGHGPRTSVRFGKTPSKLKSYKVWEYSYCSKLKSNNIITSEDRQNEKSNQVSHRVTAKTVPSTKNHPLVFGRC